MIEPLNGHRVFDSFDLILAVNVLEYCYISFLIRMFIDLSNILHVPLGHSRILHPYTGVKRELWNGMVI